MAVTYNDLYLDLRQELRKAGIEAATLEARELVCFASGKTREQFLRDSRLYAPESVVQEVARLKERHLAGEPVAYLIGEWEFYGLPLDISSAVLIPRVDTEVLAGETMAYLKTLGSCRVLDLCAGSGCVGLAIADRCENAHVTLGELSSEALKICRQNIRRSGLSGRVVPMQVDALEKPAKSLGEFDCIVSNPPYIPSSDIPGLDGSRLLFLLLEGIRRKPVKRELEGAIHFAGLVLLMALMVVLVYKDVLTIVTGGFGF